MPPISLITTERIDIGKSRPQQWATSDLGSLPLLSNGGWPGEAPLASVGVVAVQRAGDGAGDRAHIVSSSQQFDLVASGETLSK